MLKLLVPAPIVTRKCGNGICDLGSAASLSLVWSTHTRCKREQALFYWGERTLHASTRLLEGLLKWGAQWAVRKEPPLAYAELAKGMY